MSEFWNHKFEQNPELYGQAPNAWFESSLQEMKVSPGHAFLPGEGEGRNAAFLLQKGWQVTALDGSEPAIAHARAKLKTFGKKFTYLHGLLPETPLPTEPFDLIGLIYFHLPPETRNLVHKDLIKRLKPGGFIFLEAFHPEQLHFNSGGPKQENMLYRLEDLCQDFTGLHWHYLAKTPAYLNEGIGHQGEARLVRMIAQKPI